SGNDSAAGPARPRRRSEVSRFLGWLVGLVLILICGWGAVGFCYFLARHFNIEDLDVVALLAAAASLMVFLRLAKNFLLSRLMGLHIEPGSPTWKYAVLTWLLGVASLLVRSTDIEAPETAVTGTNNRPSPATGKRAEALNKPTDSFREVVETVVFVVVLVLLLKSFVAEAFVIPTGSMAETLYGYQKMVKCPKCGSSFPVNCSQEVDPQGDHVSEVVGGTCPNCRYYVDFRDVYGDKNRWPSWNTGDRVLVAKFEYDFNVGGLDMPERYQVVVFKYPETPQKNYIPLNYIKRLIGLPRETIAIHYGKLYRYVGLNYDQEDEGVPKLELWKKDHMHVDDKAAGDLFAEGKFEI